MVDESRPESNGLCPHVTTPTQAETLALALSYRAAGLSVILIRPDGSKQPFGQWKRFQEQRMEEEPLNRILSNLHFGLAIITGKVSGNLELIDFDLHADVVFPKWCELVEKECPGLIARLPINTTPKRGFHVRYRCPEIEIPGNLKLAFEPFTNDTGKPAKNVLIETRGEGGYALAPGCPPDCHPTKGLYLPYSGPAITDMPTIAAAEREVLIRCARSFDRAAPQPRHVGNGRATQAGATSWQDYDRRGPEWIEIIGPSGWSIAHQSGDTLYWRRPGKDGPGWSATTGHCRGDNGEDLLHVFSSNAHPFEDGKTYSKSAAHALLNHDGDFKASARDLGERGYGEQTGRRPRRARRAGRTDEAATGEALAANPTATAAATDRETSGCIAGPLVLESYADPHWLARAYLAQHAHPDRCRLAFYREQFWRWVGTRWVDCPDAEIAGELAKFCKAAIAENFEPSKNQPKMPKVTTGLVRNVMQALSGEVGLPTDTPQPSWIGDSRGRRNFVAMENGLFDLDAYLSGQTDVGAGLHAHTPNWFSPFCLPYSFDSAAECPLWQKFLGRNLEGDAARIALAQEWFGYCLTPDTSRQKFVVLEGEGSNGKSVFCAALEAFLGRDNCSHVPLEAFGDRFQLTATLGKLANIASEVGELDKAAEGFLKSFTSGDMMQFDRKFKPPVQALPTARLVLATNNRPRFSDRSGGLWRRMILLPFRVVIAADDPDRVFGMDKPDYWEKSGDLPGMFIWGLAGLAWLRERGCFTRSELCEQALAEYRTENNPARMFLLETCKEAPEGQVSTERLYDGYRKWCTKNGYSPLANNNFGGEVRRVFLKADRRKLGESTHRFHCWCGIDAPGLEGVP